MVVFKQILELATVTFSWLRNAYLLAGVATRRATKNSTDMCLSSLKNVCEVACF